MQIETIEYDENELLELKIESLHDEAMKIVALAEGDFKRNNVLFRGLMFCAYNIETLAAMKAINTDIEPLRSMILLSAASLAFQLEQVKAGQIFVESGLSGKPPIEIKRDLLDLSIRFDSLNDSGPNYVFDSKD